MKLTLRSRIPKIRISNKIAETKCLKEDSANALRDSRELKVKYVVAFVLLQMG